MNGSRFRLREPATTEGHIDGAWWPRRRDLVSELTPLLADLQVGGGPVGRVIYGKDYWTVSARTMCVDDRLVRLGGFSMPAGEVLSFIDRTGSRRRLDVAVIAPDTDPIVAERILTLAGKAGNVLRLGEILMQAADVGVAV